MRVGDLLAEAFRVVLPTPLADTAHLEQTASGASAVDLVRAAERHGALPALHVALGESTVIQREARAAMAAEYHRGALTHLQALDGLRTVRRALDGVTPWLVMKGPVLSGFLYHRPDLRSYIDLDLLVPPTRFADAIAALEEAGCVLADRNWVLLRSQVPGELRLMLPSGLWIDLHWHVINRASVRDAFDISTEALIERRREVALPGLEAPVPTLDRADTLMHLATHACLSGGDRLSWAADLHEAIRHDRTPWAEVGERAREQGTALVVGVMLRRAHRAIPLGIPAEVLDLLAPRPGWAVVTGAVDRVSPLAASSGRPSTARIVLRSTRSSGTSSTVELIRRSAHWVAGGSRRQRRALNRDPSSPTSFLHAAGGDTEREAFFDLVREGARAHGLPPASR